MSYPGYTYPLYFPYVTHPGTHTDYGGHAENPIGYPTTPAYSGNNYTGPNYPSGYAQRYPLGYSSGYAPGYPYLFSIIKTESNTDDDDVTAINDYDTLTLKSADPEHLIITGDKAERKVTFNLSFAESNHDDYGDHLVTNLIRIKKRLFIHPFEGEGASPTELGGGGELSTQNSFLKVINCTPGNLIMTLEKPDGLWGDGLQFILLVDKDSPHTIEISADSVTGSSNIALAAGKSYPFVYNWVGDNTSGSGIWYPLF